MGAWIMSIVGVICLGLLLEIVLPDGQTAKYVRGAFSLLVVFVIAAPLPALLKKDWKLDLNGYQFEIDEGYVNSTQAAYSENTARSLERYLAENGYVSRVKILTGDSMPITLKGVEVTVTNFKQETAPQVSASVKELVSGKLNCDEDAVIVALSSG